MRFPSLGGTLVFAMLASTPALAQIPLYAQRLPDGTVYVRLVNALPGAASIQTDFAGKVALGAGDAARISPYYVAGEAGGKTVTLQVSQDGGAAQAATFAPKSGTFVTVVLHPKGSGVTADLITDKPEYNQLRARLSFYNATADCSAGSLAQAGGPTIFSGVAANAARARSINPVTAKVTASCGAGHAPTLDLGELQAGGLYSVWMMQPAGTLTAFVAHDTIAPPQ